MCVCGEGGGGGGGGVGVGGGGGGGGGGGWRLIKSVKKRKISDKNLFSDNVV